MATIDFKKATNLELRTIIFDDKQATQWEKAEAQAELNKRNQKRMSGRVDKHAGVRR